MIKRILIIAIIAASSFSGLSQTRHDSTVLPNKDIKALLAAFDDWKILSRENPVLAERVRILESRIMISDSIIINLKQMNDMNGLIIQDYIASEQNLIRQRTNLEAETKRLNKLIKKQKRKTFFTGAAGTIGIAAAAALIILR